jgi:signal transduction histidine kinase/ActR/RegA family two-component response regulator
MTGLRAGAVVGRTLEDIFPGAEKDWIETYGRVALTGEPVSFENYSPTVDRYFEVTAFQPQPNRFACVFADITARKRAEMERATREEHYRQAQKMESIGRLAGGVAHDLNNLLTPILGYGELLVDEFGASGAPTEYAEEIVHASRLARNLVRQLLALSRKQVLLFAPLNLNTVVAGFENLLRHTIREDVVIEIRQNPSVPFMLGDAGQLEQVLMNLAVNAQDAMPNGGTLTIATGVTDIDQANAAAYPGATPGRYVQLAVRDNGCGMDRDTKTKLFEPFFTTKEKGTGTGLGLATVYGIVKQHGGHAWVDSEPARGTTFTICLPAWEGVAGPGGSDATPRTIDAHGGTETILLVEDNELVRELAETIMERLGYTVLSAEDGAGALTVLATYAAPVHLLLTDVVMPGMNGWDLHARVAADHPGLKVLFMSGYADEVIADRGVLDAGMHFIQKPFSVSDLATKVREALHEREGSGRMMHDHTTG